MFNCFHIFLLLSKSIMMIFCICNTKLRFATAEFPYINEKIIVTTNLPGRYS